ncbi:hypothetical protein ACLB2K_038592 [Fragaria x ananassa]
MVDKLLQTNTRNHQREAGVLTIFVEFQQVLVEAKFTFFIVSVTASPIVRGAKVNDTSQIEAVRMVSAEDFSVGCSILLVEAFNSETKPSGVLIKRKADNTIHVHYKGDAEMIPEMCTCYTMPSELLRIWITMRKRKFEQIIQGMSASSLRCIVFANKEVPAEEQIEVKKAGGDCRYAALNIRTITDGIVVTKKAPAT